MAAFSHNCVLQHAHMRLNRFGIDIRKKRIYILPDGDEIDSVLAENTRQHAASRTIHAIDGELELRLRYQVEVREPADCPNVGRLQVDFFNFRSLALRHRPSRSLLLNDFHNCRGCRATKFRLELHSIPVPGIVTGSDNHRSCRACILHRVRHCRRGHVVA